MSLDETVAFLMRGVEYGDSQIHAHMQAELRERLAESAQSSRPLRVYCGYDPTAPDLHLGHTVTMRKLRQFQDLGHHVIFLLGTYTALIGDASDKDKARPLVDAAQIEANLHSYTEQAFKVLDRERTEVRRNGEWLERLGFEDFLRLASNFTVQQFLARENFAQRFEAGDPIWLHEFFYPLMQGYDAVVLEADVQLGGTEQLFNLMAGRKLQQAFGMRPQIVLTLPILVGTDGHVRMSKSLGNSIGIDEPPEVMYGKVMSLPDAAMENYFNLVTRWTPAQIADMLERLADGTLHPMEAKKALAEEIVASLHGVAAASRAAAHFARVHQARDLPEAIPSYGLVGPVSLVDLMVDAGCAPSKAQARRLIRQNGVRLNGETVMDIETVVSPAGQVLQVGKRRFLRLVASSGPDNR